MNELKTNTGTEYYERTKRVPYERPGKKQDKRGTVYVSVKLKAQLDGGLERGNKTKQFTVRDVKVSEVAEVVERALFGDVRE